MARLVLTGEDGGRREIKLGRINTIGRHPNNSIQILDRIASKEHAKIVRNADGQYLLQNLGSMNGTFIEGRRVSEVVLTHGTEVVFGSTRALFEEDGATTEPEGRVTFVSGEAASHIRERVSAEGDFVPAAQVTSIDALRRDYETLRTAYEVSRSLSLELDLDKLLEKVLAKAFEMLQADRGVILLMDPRTGKPVPRVVKQRLGPAEEGIVLSQHILNEVLRSRQALLSHDALVDPRFSQAHSIIVQGIRSTMTVPLLYGEEMLGIVHLDSMIASNAFTERDLQVLRGIAAQAAVSIQNARLARRIEEAARTRAQFERLLAPDLVEKVVSGQISVEKGGQLHEVTILFGDIRGFTSMSEKYVAQDIVLMLNEYFEVMVECVLRNGGSLDKFVGDEIMALFGSPLAPQPDAPWRAVQCALDMQRAMQAFNQTRESEDQPPIRIGIGVNTGDVVCGMIGSSKSLQYTVIGDAVNVAARLCSHAEPGGILVSEDTLSHVVDRVHAEPVTGLKLKGKSEAVRIFRVLGHRMPEEESTTGYRL